MVERTCIVQNEFGLHARAASLLVQTAARFGSHIEIWKDGQRANAKSPIEVLTLFAARGAQLVVRASGRDAAQAVMALEALILDGFGER